MIKFGRFQLPRLLAIVASLLVLSGVAAAQTPSAPGPAMTNDDIVKMAKLGFGDDVIQAKIQEAPAVAFKLEVDDLGKLKAAGVSQNVISAMLKRSTAPAQPAGSPNVVTGPGGMPGFSDVGTVKLISKDHGTVDLRSIGGTMSTTYAYVTMLMHANYPGLKADARTQDHRPTLLIRSPTSPKGRMYLVSADADSGSNVRSVKMGNSRLFGAKNLGAPDSDNQIECDVVAEGTDGWRLTPTKDLKPGEYGLWVSVHSMYDFGVDP
jgi:hypothetical protein